MTYRVVLRALGVLCLLLATAAGLFAMQVNTWLKPVEIPVMAQDPVLISIPSGSSSVRIAHILQDAGMIRHAAVFRYYAKYYGKDQSLKAGNYLLRYGMTLDQILDELNRGNVYRPTVTVTIPEGFTLEQIAQRLAQNGLVDQEEFMNLAKGTMPAMGRSVSGQRYTLEGYLFPDTYEFDINVSAETVLNRMQTRLSGVFTPELRARAEELGMDMHQVITLASLVEREVQAAKERDMVAAVLHNRIKKKMPLQICATVIYALGEHRTELTLKDLETESPYNTYKYPGLPPGPIASPGKQAIMAVLYPADVDYLYYVLKGDGTGTHYFGKTFKEHQANIRRARSNR